MDVSVCIPTKNGGQHLEQVLRAVFAQQTELSYEVICVDSGSTDDTLDIIKRYPFVKMHSILPEEFGHGKTRNLAASLGKGRFICFLTQDAVPATDHWLDELVRAVMADDRCALGIGIHYPWPDCNPLDARGINEHFAAFGTQRAYYRIDDPQRYAQDDDYRRFLTFSSDNNACMRRSVWEQMPFEDVSFAEDQRWAQQILEAGWSKVYCPNAPVWHSHSYRLSEQKRRYYDEYKQLHRLHGYRLVRTRAESVRAALASFRSDAAYLMRRMHSPAWKLKWCAYALLRELGRHRMGRLAGAWAALPADRQKRLDERYSQLLRQQKEC